MKLLCATIGALFILIIVILSPWPEFIQDVANKLLAVPGSAGDAVWVFVLKVFNIGAGYILFPLFGGAFGLLAAYIINRRYD
jgi:hypothetical protein